MPIRTKMQKSGMKNVVNKKRSNVSGRLNRAARAVSTGERSKLTPGAVTEIFDGAGTRIRNKKQAAITAATPPTPAKERSRATPVSLFYTTYH